MFPPGWLEVTSLLLGWTTSKSGVFLSVRLMGVDCIVRSGKGYADDYYLDSKSQCAGKRGACPDR